MDLGLLRKSKTPSKGGVLDLGLLRKSKTPLQGGVLDLGLLKSPDPGSRGGVFECDVSIIVGLIVPNCTIRAGS